MTTTSHLRLFLRQALPSDSDLEAFCVDYFPEVYRRYSRGMDPQTKLSLLLHYEKPERIHAALVELLQCEPAKLMPQRLLGSDDGIDGQAGISGIPAVASRWTDAPYRTLGLIGLSILVLLAVGSAVRGHLEAARSNAAVTLCTTPPGAEVWDLRKGRSLGTTPLFIDPIVLPLVVCLRIAGFHDQIISLANGQIPRTAVVLRPVGSSQPEICDVPIPILP